MFIKGKYSGNVCECNSVRNFRTKTQLFKSELPSTLYGICPSHFVILCRIVVCYFVGNLRVETSYIIQVNWDLLSMKSLLEMCVKVRLHLREECKDV